MSFVTNKTFIITGASSGIGRALAIELAGRGASLVLNARRSDTLFDTAHACREAGKGKGVRVDHRAGNCAYLTVAETLVDTAVNMGGGEHFGGFIHAAGTFYPGPALWELSDTEFDEIFEASVKGAWQLMRFAGPVIRANAKAESESRGVAVVFGSGAAQITQPGIAAYCAAKAAEEHLLRQFGAEVPEARTLIYRPGLVDTRMQAQARQSSGEMADALAEVFTKWKENNELIAPEESARYLAALLDERPEELDGRTVRYGD